MKITQKQLTAWNLAHKSNSLKYAVSANENWNRQMGLPDPETRAILRRIHSDKFGIMSGKLTMKMVREHTSRSR